MDCGIGVTSCKRGDQRLLDKVFESKPIKRGGKIPFQQFKENIHLNFKQMSSQITNNNYATTPTSPNPYISKRVNNMDEAQAIKKERDNWTKLYHKTLKGIKTMIDMQKIVKNIKKIAEVVNMTITKMEGSILIASINNRNNRMTNAMNILGISEDLRYLIQSDIKDQTFQIQRMLADELDRYIGRGNSYMDKNIQEIQKLYMNEEQQKKEEGKVEDKEVILIKPYEISESTSTRSSSFIDKEIDNLLKYMKFVKSPT